MIYASVFCFFICKRRIVKEIGGKCLLICSLVTIEGPRPGALKISKKHCCVESEYGSHHFECVFGRHRERYTFYEKKDDRVQVRKAASNQPFETESGALSSKNYGDALRSFLDAFYRFSRPHTVIGTVTFFQTHVL